MSHDVTKTAEAPVPMDEPGVLLSSYHAVREALFERKLVQNAHKRFEVGNILDGVVMQLHLPEHRDRRRIENPLFRPDAVREYERIRIPTIIDEVLDRAIEAGIEDALEIAHILTIILSADISGIDIDARDLETVRRLVDLERTFVQGASITDSTRDKQDVMRDVRAALAAFDEEFFDHSRRRRVAMIDSGEVESPSDLLTALLLAQGQLGLDDQLVLRETAFFLESASHTTSLTVANALLNLFAWREADSERWREITEEPQGVRSFLQRVGHETVRLSPVVPLLRRRAAEDVHVGGTFITAGTAVFLDAVRASRDPEVFGPTADRFDPDRELSDGILRYGLGFGGGHHACIGRVLAAGVEETATGNAREGTIMGEVALILEALVTRGIDRHPARDAVLDESTHRLRIRELPVSFGARDLHSAA